MFFRNLWRDAVIALAQVGLGMTFLAFHAVDTLHAIVVTLVRLVVTHRSLLEWETAATAAARDAGVSGRQALQRFVREMSASPIVAAIAGILVLTLHRSAFPAAAPFLLLWIAAPAVAYWLSIPVGARERPLSEGERRLLRRTARSTWRYFEEFVTEAESWLPPDNVQEHDNRTQLARRTSPTNIGMGLLSAVAAHELGYVSTDALAARLTATLTTLEGLERYEGHFLNWYDTTTLAPLSPRYVSTVDSGNLAASLIAVSQGLLAIAEQPQTREQRSRGLADTAELLTVASASVSSTESPERRQTLTAINSLARAMAAEAHGEARDPRAGWLDGLAQQLADAAAAPELAGAVPGATDVEFWAHAVVTGVHALDAETAVSGETLRTLARRASRLADDMRFDRLYDRRRKIFAIGYRLADAHGPGRFDNAFYDLLASEARLASFVAIAKGDVPQDHWFHLGRLLTSVHGRATLMSWSGTMFEVLDAAAPDAKLPGHALGPELPGGRSPANRVRARAACAMGHLGVRVRVHRPRRCVPVPAHSACPASGSAGDWPTSWWSRPMRRLSRAS